jgi:hypothetical protein
MPKNGGSPDGAPGPTDVVPGSRRSLTEIGSLAGRGFRGGRDCTQAARERSCGVVGGPRTISGTFRTAAAPGPTRMMPETQVQVPVSAEQLGPPCPRVFELARAIPAQNWMLIGGPMVQAHAMAASISAVRPTDDIDVIVRVGTSRPNALTTVTQGRGRAAGGGAGGPSAVRRRQSRYQRPGPVGRVDPKKAPPTLSISWTRTVTSATRRSWQRPSPTT